MVLIVVLHPMRTCDLAQLSVMSFEQLVQIITDLAWLLLWVNADHMQGTLVMSIGSCSVGLSAA